MTIVGRSTTNPSATPVPEQEHHIDPLLTPTVNLVTGTTVCVTDPEGQIEPGGHHGLYHRDIRVLSQMTVAVDGHEPLVLSSTRQDADRAEQVWGVETDPQAVPTAVLVRARHLGQTMVDTYELRGYGTSVSCDLTIRLGSDFATLHKGVGAAEPTPFSAAEDGSVSCGEGPAAVHITATAGSDTTLTVPQDGVLVVRMSSGAQGPSRVRIEVSPTWNGAVQDRPSPTQSSVTVRTVDPRWGRAIRSAQVDGKALTIEDVETGVAVPAAGAPWFLALFGRDSLLTAYSRLVVDADAALGVLDVLAHHQGTREVPHRLEQPGRILHELRTGGLEVFTTRSGEPYYGTVDAPSLFIIVLAEALRFGAEPARVEALLPAARAALDWSVGAGDIDSDGWIEYDTHAGGLVNQGWKDSGDCMVHRDGTLAEGPIALCEVQAYRIRAQRDLAHLESRLGNADSAAGLREAADDAQRAFRADYWRPELGLIAMALDGQKRPLEVASSNMGHCLWAEAVDEDVAAVVADRLLQPDMLTSVGVRTLSADNPAFNPLGYHTGSIWPHDNAIIAEGLRRYGFEGHAMSIVDRLLDVAYGQQGRLPEIYAGFDPTDPSGIVAYPASCSPQAWSAAAPLSLLRTTLGLHPDVPQGHVVLEPAAAVGSPFEVAGLAVGPHRLDITIDSAQAPDVVGAGDLEILPDRHALEDY